MISSIVVIRIMADAKTSGRLSDIKCTVKAAKVAMRDVVAKIL